MVIRMAMLLPFVLGGHLAVCGVIRADEPTRVGQDGGKSAQRVAQIVKRDNLWQQAQQLLSDQKPAAAIVAGEQVLALNRELFGDTAAELTETLQWLSVRYLAQQNMLRAEERAVDLLRIQTALHTPDGWQAVSARWHLDYVRKLSQVASQTLAEMQEIETEVERCLEANKHVDAAGQLAKLIPVEEVALGNQHPHLANTFLNQADCLIEAEQYAAAEVAAERGLSIRRQRLGDRHPDTADAASIVALARKRQGKHKESLSAWELARDSYRAIGNAEEAAWADYQRGESFAGSSMIGEAVAAYTASLEAFRSLEIVDGECVLLERLADMYRLMSESAKAESLLLQLLDLKRKSSGDRDASYAKLLNKLGSVYVANAEYAKAESVFQQAIRILEEALLERDPEYSTSLNNLAVLYANTGDFLAALPLQLKCLDILKKSSDDRPLEYSASLGNLAVLYWSMGESAKAEPLFQQALDLRAKVEGRKTPDYAMLLNNQAAFHHSIGEFAKAELLHLQVLGLRKELVGEDHEDYAVSLNNLADVYQSLADYASAEPLLLQANGIIKKLKDDHHPDYATSLSNVAVLYCLMGNYEKAEPLLLLALEIRRKTLGEHHPDYAGSLHNLAWLYRATADYGKAESYLLRALEIRERRLGTNHPYYAESLIGLALTRFTMLDYRRAEPELRRALLSISVHLDRTAAVLTERQQLALSQSKAGYLASYLSCLQQLEGREEEAFEAILAWKGSTMVRQRGLRLVTSQPELAPMFSELQQVTRRWAQLATTAAPSHQQERYRQQLDLLSAQREKLEVELSRRSAVYRTAVEKVTLSQLVGALPLNAALLDYFVYDNLSVVPLQSKGDLGIRISQEGSGTRITELIEGKAAATDGRLQLNDLIVAVRDGKGEWMTTAGQELSAVVNLLTGPAAEPVELRIARDGVPLPLEYRIDRKELPFQKKVEYQWTPTLLACALRRGAPGSAAAVDVQMVNLGPVAPITAAIDTFRLSFASGKSAESTEAGRFLRKTLWEPLLGAIGDANTILISPDGSLGRLPFAALPGREPGTWLIEDHRLALIPVPQLIPTLVNDQSRWQPPQDLLLLGAVDYDNASAEDVDGPQPVRRLKPGDVPAGDPRLLRSIRGDSKWGWLDETGKEIEFVRGLWTRVYAAKASAFVDLSGSSATEAAFRRHGPDCRVLHLATHGFFAAPDKQSVFAHEGTGDGSVAAVSSLYGDRREQIRGFSPGLLSGLVFAGANRPFDGVSDPLQSEDLPDDGIMTADELATLRLDGVHLVVLSACETGLGETAGGEGLLGIQRAFQVAGVRATVGTYWGVRDLSTRRIMEEFYVNYIEKQMSVLDAMREAQLWALRHPEELLGSADKDRSRGARRTAEGKTKQTPPLYWAAFQVSGDWR